MREQTTALQEFDAPTEPVWTSEIINAFRLPERNWNGLVDSFNSANKRKFPFTSEQCKLIVEYVKQGVPPEHIFESYGISSIKYHNLVNKAADLDDRLEQLVSKEELDSTEYDEFQSLMRNPFRILISDIARAEGVSSLADWELFNHKIKTQPDLLMAKMRARYKKYFNDKETGAGSPQVVINLGGDFLEKM